MGACASCSFINEYRAFEAAVSHNVLNLSPLLHVVAMDVPRELRTLFMSVSATQIETP